MAILFRRTASRGVFLALAMSGCLIGYAIAADIVVKKPNTTASPTTQPSVEVFDVKSKDIPAPDAPKTAAPVAGGSEIPPPDFKEFEDDKFINNLLGEDEKKAAKPSAKADPSKEPVPNKATEPLPPVATDNAAITPPVAPDSKEAVAAPVIAPPADAAAKPVAEVPASPAAAVPAPAAPTAAASPSGLDDLASPPTTATSTTPTTNDTPPAIPDVAATPAKTEEKPDATAENSKKPAPLSEEDKKSYSELKKHLLNFIAVANGKAATPEKEIAKVDAAPPPAAEAKPTDDTVAPQAAPATPVEPGTVAKVETPPATKPVADDFNDFLEPDAKKVESAPAAVAAAPSNVAVPVPAPTTAVPRPEDKAPAVAAAPVIPQDKKIVQPAPVATEIKNEAATTPSKTAKATDIVAPLPPKHIDEEKLDKLELAAPVEHEKLNEADKAYIKMLDKQREALPDSKKLSDTSIATIKGFSATLAPVKKGAKKEPQYIKVEHGDTGVPGKEEDGVTKSQTKMDISVRKGGKSEDFEKSKVKLDKAYKALLVGQTAASISIYKEVLEKEPKNKDAMFGLATAYHKNSQYEQAREIYTKILKKDPGDKEALNNFLVLVAEEAPEDALIELEKLERINSNFSPIAAQIAMINLRLGNPEKAARYLRRAILLSPENISYKYNLAVVYDKAGKEEQALPLYHQVVEAANTGESVPGAVDKITERMNYLEKKISEKK